MSVFTLRDMAFLAGNQGTELVSYPRTTELGNQRITEASNIRTTEAGVGGNETWTPAELNPALWLDAADSFTLFDATSGGVLVSDGGTVRRWEDKSGNSRHATSSTGPIYSAANNRLQFNGSTYLQCTPGWGNYWELICVLRFDRTDILQVPFRDSLNSNGTCIVGYTTNNTSFYRIRETFSGLSTSISAEYGVSTRIVGFSSRTTNRGFVYRDGVERVNFNASGNVGADLYLGINGIYLNSGLIGSISEFILLSTEADTTTRQRLEGYLAHKWGLTANLPNDHPYKTVAP